MPEDTATIHCMAAWHGCRPSKVKNHQVFWIGSFLGLLVLGMTHTSFDVIHVKIICMGVMSNFSEKLISRSP